MKVALAKSELVRESLSALAETSNAYLAPSSICLSVASFGRPSNLPTACKAKSVLKSGGLSPRKDLSLTCLPERKS